MQAPKVVMLMYKYHKRTPEERHKEIDELSKRLESGIQEYLHSNRYKELLDAFAKFPNYSLNNTILIMLQRPDASLVNSYTGWQKLGRNVRRGEKGIAIWAPMPVKVKSEQQKLDEKGNPILKPDGTPEMESIEHKHINGFKIQHTFDIKQTEVRADAKAPDLNVVKELNGDYENYDALMKAIYAASPVPITVEKLDTGVRGYFNPSENRICIKEGLSQQSEIEVVCHELGHALLHNSDQIIKRHESGLSELTTAEKELEAESVSYIVSAHYGIDTSSYSFPYTSTWLTGYDKNVSSDDIDKTVKEHLQTIKDTASQMIEKIDHQLELQQVKSKQLSSISDKKQLNSEAKDLTNRTANYLKQHDPSFAIHEAYKGAAIDAMYHDIRHGNTEGLQKKIESISKTNQSKPEAKQLSESIKKFTEKVQEELTHEHTHSLSRSR